MEGRCVAPDSFARVAEQTSQATNLHIPLQKRPVRELERLGLLRPRVSNQCHRKLRICISNYIGIVLRAPRSIEPVYHFSSQLVDLLSPSGSSFRQ